MAERTSGRDTGGGGDGNGSALTCPKAVRDSARARAIWDETTPSVPQGKGGPVYSRMLGQYCLALARAEEASDLLGSDSPDKTKLIVSGGKQGGAKRSPFLDIVKEQNDVARKLAAELGLMGGSEAGNPGSSSPNGGEKRGAPEGGGTGVWGRRPRVQPSHGGQIPVYTSPAEETFETQADFARRHGVSRPAVGKWKAQGFLVFQGDRIDVRASDANLRGANLGRFGKAAEAPASVLTGEAGLQPGLQPDGASPDYTEGAEGGEALDYGAAADFLQDLLDGKFASIARAGQVKENALAGVRVLEFLKTSGSLVDLELARNVLFEQARTFRDTLMKWPADIGPRLAAEIDRPADTVTGALTRYVHTLLTDLGEPDPEFAEHDE